MAAEHGSGSMVRAWVVQGKTVVQVHGCPSHLLKGVLIMSSSKLCRYNPIISSNSAAGSGPEMLNMFAVWACSCWHEPLHKHTSIRSRHSLSTFKTGNKLSGKVRGVDMLTGISAVLVGLTSSNKHALHQQPSNSHRSTAQQQQR